MRHPAFGGRVRNTARPIVDCTHCKMCYKIRNDQVRNPWRAPLRTGLLVRGLSVASLAVASALGCNHAADATAPPQSSENGQSSSISVETETRSRNDYLAAVVLLKRLANITEEDDVSRITNQYFDIEGQEIDSTLTKRLIEDIEIQKWGNQVSEFLGLVQMVYSFADEAFQTEHRQEFDESVQKVESLRQRINDFVLKVHPGHSRLRTEKLRANATGAGVTVAVFDVFEPDILARQRGHYATATIEDLKVFSSPVNMNHGNSVIDIVLSLAPAARIVPITADTAAYNDAIRYILSRGDIDIVNMSRALLKNKANDHLDDEFAALFRQTVQTKIVTKSLGNTGTDLDGNLTTRRTSLGLGPVGNLFSYDLKLIKEFLDPSSPAASGSDLLLFAMNLNPFAEKMSLTATVPGNNQAAQSRTLGTPSDGIFSWATGNFESGSSFGAPELAGLAAMLVEVHLTHHPNATREAYSSTVSSLKRSARATVLPNTDIGLGLADGDAALQLVVSP